MDEALTRDIERWHKTRELLDGSSLTSDRTEGAKYEFLSDQVLWHGILEFSYNIAYLKYHQFSQNLAVEKPSFRDLRSKKWFSYCNSFH
ncbi:hypothetical protein WN51_00242 [Melipona quadrifasciata]|uniref:Uncharacterized protein n=1 Tax=Melipona quadrifasciata TaxID=166423 RepID=A0A0M9A293_9HYME|nr:hypothetical protein WN51_00242 [Melipona quadrifasciata]